MAVDVDDSTYTTARGSHIAPGCRKAFLLEADGQERLSLVTTIQGPTGRRANGGNTSSSTEAAERANQQTVRAKRRTGRASHRAQEDDPLPSRPRSVDHLREPRSTSYRNDTTDSTLVNCSVLEL